MNVTEMTDEQLREVAKRYDVDCPRSADRHTLEDLVEVAMYKHRLALEEKAKDQRKQEMRTMLGINVAGDAKPPLETVEIMNSEKVYAVFTNVEPEGDGADVAFVAGTIPFHLWPDFLHVLPRCLIDWHRDMKDPRGKRPIYARRPSPTNPQIEIDQVIGNKRRFSYEILEDKPPKNAAFGVVLNHKVYEKLGVPYPQPVGSSG